MCLFFYVLIARYIVASHPEIRAAAARNLRSVVEAIVREMPLDTSAKFLSDMTIHVFELVNSHEVFDKLAGIALIDELIEIKNESNETLIIRFANAFRILFQQSPSHSDPIVLEMAAKSLGHVARLGNTLTTDIVEFQVKQAFEWLSSDQHEKRHLAAVLILKELAANTPILFHVYMPTFLDHIWVAIHSPRLEIRESGISALRVCLIDIANRQTRWKLQCYFKIYSEATAGAGISIKAKPVHVIHGSLLTLGELLTYNSGDFMIARYKAICDIILHYKDHNNEMIVRTVIAIIPKLAVLLPDMFVRDYLQTSLQYILQQINTNNRDIAFLALGQVSMVSLVA